MNYSISVIIPNYNGKFLLERNIPFVLSALETSGIADFEIIVSDDNSIDDSVAFLEDHFPEIKVIVNKQKKGFSCNINNGIFAATKDLILLLNSDVELTNGYFVTLLPFFDKSDTFGVTGRIIGMDSGNTQDAAKYPDYSFADIIGTTNYVSSTDSVLYSFFMSGANSLVDRKKLLLLGGFSEIFNPYYWEDVDLGIRAWRTGYKIYYEGNAVCRHPNSATIIREPLKKVKITSKRNKMFLHYLHFSGIELSYFLFKITLKSILRTLVGDIYYLKAFYLFINSFPALKKTKNEFKQLQKNAGCNRSVKDVVKLIKEEIIFSDIKKF